MFSVKLFNIFMWNSTEAFGQIISKLQGLSCQNIQRKFTIFFLEILQKNTREISMWSNWETLLQSTKTAGKNTTRTSTEIRNSKKTQEMNYLENLRRISDIVEIFRGIFLGIFLEKWFRFSAGSILEFWKKKSTRLSITILK